MIERHQPNNLVHLIYERTLIYIGCISENASFMQFYVILPDIPSYIQLALNNTRNNWGSESSKSQ